MDDFHYIKILNLKKKLKTFLAIFLAILEINLFDFSIFNI